VTVYIDRLDETGPNVYTSPQLEAELGYTVDEWSSDKDLYAKVLHPEDRDWVLAEYARRRDSDVPFRAEYRMIARDGAVHWYHDEATVIRDGNGQASNGDAGRPNRAGSISHPGTRRRPTAVR
jgi:PAS domain S-box-containing protein